MRKQLFYLSVVLTMLVFAFSSGQIQSPKATTETTVQTPIQTLNQTTTNTTAEATDIQALIAKIQKQIVELQAQLAQLQGQVGTAAWCHTFNANIGVGLKKGNPEIDALVIALQKEGILQQGNFEYDEIVASAVVEFQEKYASEILSPYNLKHGTGFVGKSTRAKLNALYGCNVVCTQEAKQCPDGSYVSRTGPNCEFAKCPIFTQCKVDTDCPQTTCSSLATVDSVTTCLGSLTKCVEGKCVSSTCRNLWWYDILHKTCSQKQFCGAYMYLGLKTFETEDACKKDLAQSPQCKTDGDCIQMTCLLQPDGTTLPSCLAMKCVDEKCVAQPRVSIKIISPNGGEIWSQGSTQKITWTTSNIPASNMMTVRLRDRVGGVEHYLSESGVLNTGSFSFAVPSTLIPGLYRAEVKTAVNGVSYLDSGDNYFSIVAPGNQCVADSDCPQPSCAVTADGKINCPSLLKCVEGKCVSQTQPLTASSSYLIGNQATYTAGQTIKFSVKAVASGGSAGSPDKGFNVQAWMQTSDPVYANQTVQINGVYQSFNASYNSSTGYWDVLMTAPSDTSKTYTINTAFYCSNSQMGCSRGQINKSFTFSLSPTNVQPSITIISPNGGETWQTGQAYTIKWSSSAIATPDYVYIALLDNTRPNIGAVWNVDAAPNTGSYYFTLPSASNYQTIIPGNQYKITISQKSGGSDFSDNYFSIVSAFASADVNMGALDNQQNLLASISDAVAKLTAQLREMMNK